MVQNLLTGGNRNFNKYNEFSQTFGGYCLMFESFERINQLTENFLSTIRHKISIKFHNFNISKIRTDQINLKYLSNFDNNNSLSEKYIDKQTTARLILRLQPNQLSWRLSCDSNIALTPFARLPLPENPLIPFGKDTIGNHNINIQDFPYPNLPEYYIDITKNCSLKFFDIPADKYEIETNSEFYNFIIEYMKNFPYISRIHFPIFHLNSNPIYSIGERGASPNYTIFGLIKFAKRDIDDSFIVEFLIFPYNFIEFNFLWDEAIRNTNALLSKIPPEYPQDFLRKIELYFEKTPSYYMAYILQGFGLRKMTILAQKSWKFLNSYPILKINNLMYDKFFENCLLLTSERLELKREVMLIFNNFTIISQAICFCIIQMK